MDNQTYNRKSAVRFRLVLLLILAAGVALTAFGFAMYFRCRAIPEDSLTQIQGTLQSTDREQKGERRTYFVKLEEYSSTFVLDGESMSEEEWNEFVGGAPLDGRISFSIQKSDADKLQNADSLALYDLYSDGKCYHSLPSRNAAMRKNAAAGLTIGCTASALTILLIAVFFRFRKLAKKLF